VANFPINPGIGSIFTDTTSGFRYKWTGSVWKSFTGSAGSDVQEIDDISSSFDNSTTTFALTSGGSAFTPANAKGLTISLGGVIQEPGTDYTVSGTNITFTTAPNVGLDFFGLNRSFATDIITKNNVVDNLSVSGIGTITNIQATNLNVSGVTTANSTQLTQLNVSGVTTVGVVTGATSLQATVFYGDGSQLDHISAGVGIQSGGTLVSYGATTLNFTGTGASVRSLGSNAVEVLITGGGGGGGSIGISSNSYTTFTGTGVTHLNFVGAAVTMVGLTTAAVTVTKTLTVGLRTDAASIDLATGFLSVQKRDGSDAEIPV